HPQRLRYFNCAPPCYPVLGQKVLRPRWYALGTYAEVGTQTMAYGPGGERMPLAYRLVAVPLSLPAAVFGAYPAWVVLVNRRLRPRSQLRRKRRRRRPQQRLLARQRQARPRNRPPRRYNRAAARARSRSRLRRRRVRRWWIRISPPKPRRECWRPAPPVVLRQRRRA